MLIWTKQHPVPKTTYLFTANVFQTHHHSSETNLHNDQPRIARGTVRPTTNFGTAINEGIGPRKVTRLSVYHKDTVSDCIFLQDKEPYPKATQCVIFLTHSLRLYLSKTKYLFNPFDFKLPTLPSSSPFRSGIIRYSVVQCGEVL